MKFALLSTLLLSFSALRAAAIPHTASKDNNADDHATTQLAVRATNDVAAAHLDPITASVVFSLVTSTIALAVEFAAKKIAEALQASERAAKEGVVITYGNGESITEMMAKYADNFRNDHPEYVGVLLVTDGRIIGTPTLDYAMAAVEFVDTHDPEENYSTYCVTIVSKSAGFVVVAGVVNQITTRWEARGNIAIDFGRFDPTVLVPRDEVKFTFKG